LTAGKEKRREYFEFIVTSSFFHPLSLSLVEMPFQKRSKS
uniref:Uncharacterized protein n=1 Tax=Amphimedon queenslandica TaxID=400682 RepID=A0A1X7UY75_AMPQE